MIDDQMRKKRFKFCDLWASVVDICLVEFVMPYVEIFQFFHLEDEELEL